jgi:hypothetical protein
MIADTGPEVCHRPVLAVKRNSRSAANNRVLTDSDRGMGADLLGSVITRAVLLRH